ncbi:MAG: hypothetical protein QOH36_63 [Actinomycetota bacterium]|nr:hypothetical protein [Actinomycetota bacterium]
MGAPPPVSARTVLRAIGPIRLFLGAALLALMVASSAGIGRPPDDVRSSGTVTGGDTGDRDGLKPNSADRLLFWINVTDLRAMTDADLDLWRSRGVDGFVAQSQWLAGMGSNYWFTPDPRADLSDPRYALQRSLRDSKVVDRAKARGMKLYLAFNLVGIDNPVTPLVDWFDDAGWDGKVLPRVSELAGAARLLGFDGLALDQELYPQAGGVTTASWTLGYRGNTHSLDETRRKVTARGQQLMASILGQFPAVELSVYGSMFPDSWDELVQQKVNGMSSYEGSAQLPFWDGMTSVEGYRAIRFSDAIFYKVTHLRGATWDTANQYNVNRLYAMFSRRFSNWSYASSHVFVSPFAWIDAGTTDFEKARPPGVVADQLLAFRTWATGGELMNFTLQLRKFDYEPYVPGMVAASTPAVVDREPPRLEVTSVTRSGAGLEIKGTATDNLGIQAVRAGRDGTGPAAAMTWTVLDGSYESSWNWRMDWTLTTAMPAGASEVDVTAVDIKGLTTTVKVPSPS